MLKEIFCSNFSKNKIIFKKNLNVILGQENGKNSIGKSTLLMIIDFVFGGDDFIKNSDVSSNTKMNEIFFKLYFSGCDYYFCREKETPTNVWICDSKYNKISSISINEYRDRLSAFYEINNYETTFRDIVGRYSRIYGKNNLDPLRPINIVPKEPNVSAVNSLLKLFNLYEAIRNAEIESNQAKEKLEAYKSANKYEFLPNLFKSQKEYDENAKKIKNIKEKISILKNEISHNISNIDSLMTEDALQIKNDLINIKKIKANAEIKLDSISANYSYKFSKTIDDFSKLLEFFPNTNVKHLGEIEQFHSKMTHIFKSEMKEEADILKRQISDCDIAINDYSSRFASLCPKNLESEVAIDKYAKLINELNLLQNAENHYKNFSLLREKNIELADFLKNTKSTQLTTLQTSINNKMSEFDSIIAGENMSHPKIDFTDSNYTFFTKNDIGTGIGFKGLIVFDLSVLKLTNLPFLIHDTPLFKQIQDSMVEKILNEYCNFDKQIFIAFDKQNSYSNRVNDILTKNAVIKLGDGEQSLFGKIWSKIENN